MKRRRTGRVVLAGAVVLAVGGATAVATEFDFAPQDAGPRTTSGLPPATTQVTRQTLVDAQSESGELGHGTATALSGRAEGTVTGLPAAGTTIDRGHALYYLDNAPIVLLYGPLPSYRPLSVGTEGPDVKQFEENLYALGYRGFTVDTKFSETTATAVKKWQAALGMTKTGTVEQSRIAYTAGPVRIEALKAASGDDLKPGTAVLTYSGTTRVITVNLTMADQRLAQRNAAVSVKLPDGKQTSGKIATTTTVIDPGDEKTKPTTKIVVTITLDDENSLSGMDKASVDVGFTAAQRENVLTVPVASLLALAEGGYGVQVVEGTTTKVVAVKTGMYANGRVEVTGVAEGTTIGIPS